ncbi:hypothetical protein EV05_1269 [Prochlorococcus sp. MIT 0601]|nr:hypothetical protein EV05_1269 [Prochlorococcus sp. MIT 0601]
MLIALPEAANKGGVSSTNPVEPNCQQKINVPKKKIKQMHLLYLFLGISSATDSVLILI